MGQFLEALPSQAAIAIENSILFKNCSVRTEITQDATLEDGPDA
jgi:GAF domain-containing protein